MLRPALVLVLGALLGASQAPAAQRPPIALTGSATFGAVDFEAQCIRADAGIAKVVECARSGTFRAAALRGPATYTWHWHLFHGGEIPQTAHGDEDGSAVLRFGARGTLRLTLKGAKQPGVTTGRWTFASGTKTFARRRGSGTYRFETTPGTSGFGSARLVLRGTLR